MEPLISQFSNSLLLIVGLSVACLSGIVWSYACLRFAGYLKCVRHLRTGYTRKIFHFLIFATVVVVHLFWGLFGVCIFGAATSVVLAYAIFRGPSYPLFEAIAREADSPHRTYYVVVPYFATLIGGVVSNLLFGPLAVFGYLVAGLGDAVGEPVGTRWGRHRYTISYPRASTKSLEGSLAILVMSMLVLIGAGIFNHASPQMLLVVPAVALASTLMEALSPRGWDNTFLQVGPTFLVFLILRS